MSDALLKRSLAAVWHPRTQVEQHETLPPVPVGDNGETAAVAGLLYEGPGVPAASARLRVWLSAPHTEADFIRLADTLVRFEARLAT